TTTSTATCPTSPCCRRAGRPAENAPFRKGVLRVRKLLFVIGSLEYGDSARQLTLLVRHLPRGNFAVRVIVLGGASPWVAELRSAGVFVDVLGWNRPIDPRPVLALGQMLREYAPDVVHTWDRLSLRACVLAGLRGPGRLTASG